MYDFELTFLYDEDDEFVGVSVEYTDEDGYEWVETYEPEED